MNGLIKRISNQATRDLTYMYSKDHSKPEDEIIFSMVYDFTRNLPYSMDIEQDEYVPADFMNMRPYDADKHSFFKWKDQATVYTAMTSSGDTFRSGIMIQICAVFQKMLSNQFPNDYELKEEDFYSWGIDEMTADEEYNKEFFKALKILPSYYKRVQETRNNHERREALKEIYEEMELSIANRVGGFRETNAKGEVVQETKASVMWEPYRDLEMLYYFKKVNYCSRGIPDLKELIKNAEKHSISKKDALPRQLESDERTH